MKNLISLLMLVLVLVSCSDDNDTSPANIVTVIYSPNGLGDSSYNDCICQGIYKAQQKYSFHLFNRVPDNSQEAEIYLQEWIDESVGSQDNARHILLLASDEYKDMLRLYADKIEDNDRCAVILFESQPSDLPVHTFFMPYYGACYEVGQLVPAYDLNIENVLLMTANNKNKSIKDGAQGFLDGYKDMANKSAEIMNLSENESGYNIADELYQMSYFLDQNYDFIFPLVGGSQTGLLNYSRENMDAFYLAGIDVDRSMYSASVLLSVVKHIDRVIEYYLDIWNKHQKLPQHKLFGLESGMTEVIFSPFYEQVKIESLQQIHQKAIEKEALYEREK